MCAHRAALQRPRGESEPTVRVRARLPQVGVMHSFWQRLNAIFFFALSVLGFLSFAAAGSTCWHQSDPRISLSLKKLML